MPARSPFAANSGRGSTFTVTIPTGSAHIAPARIGARRTLASTALGAGPYIDEALRWLSDSSNGGSVSVRLESLTAVSTAGARVLLADDNADMRDYLTRLLRQYWDVEAVADGVAALEAMRRHRPDLVLTDVMMPRADGIAVLRAVRADTELRSLPVILLSARAGEESRVEGLEVGADDYLVKPFSARELLARVNAHLEMARVRRAALDERERVNEIIRKEEARFRSLVEATSSIVWHADASGATTHVPRWDRVTGQTQALYQGGGWLEAAHPDDREALVSAWERCVRVGRRGPPTIVCGSTTAYRGSALARSRSSPPPARWRSGRDGRGHRRRGARRRRCTRRTSGRTSSWRCWRTS
jgi:CheY-like chemotaxis protein